MTDKIPPRPVLDPLEDYGECIHADRDHEHAVAEVAVEALQKQPCGRYLIGGSIHPHPTCDCPRCKVLRQIEESGWTP